MKQIRWMKRTAAGLTLGFALLGETVYMPVTAFGAETSVYNRIVNAQSGLTSEVVNDRHYAAYQSDDSDEKTSSGRTYREEDRTTGPGAAAKVEIVEDQENDGPQVEEVSLSERYHEDFGVYEEDMGNRYFLYTTVENGGITDQPVSVDIPAGLTFVMEKDGTQIPYTSGQTISARGSYMLTLTGPDDPALPFSQQTIYKAVFRFRIQEKVVQETEEAAEAFGGGSGFSGSDSRTESTYGSEDATAASPQTEETNPETEETAAQGEPEGEEDTSQDVFNEDGTLNEDALDDSIDDLLGSDEGRVNMDYYNESTGLSSYYDTSSGLFKNELLTGAAFYTNVPNGMVTNNAVRMDTADEINFVILKDGEPLEYEDGMTFDEEGSYMIYPSQNTTVYLGEYGNTKKPLFHFRIAAGPVNDMGIFNAPEGYSIKEITRNGEPVTEGLSADRNYCYLGEDGEYEIRLTHLDGATADLTTTVTKDSIQPRFLLSVEDSTAYIQYRSSDIAYCKLYKDGELVFDQQIPAQVTGSGKYRLEAYDEAGNMAYSEFQIDYHFNMGAIVVILLVIVLIAALVLFLRRTRKQVRVR